MLEETHRNGVSSKGSEVSIDQASRMTGRAGDRTFEATGWAALSSERSIGNTSTTKL